MCLELYYKLALWITVIYGEASKGDRHHLIPSPFVNEIKRFPSTHPLHLSDISAELKTILSYT